jgi:hypothetical protein
MPKLKFGAVQSGFPLEKSAEGDFYLPEDVSKMYRFKLGTLKKKDNFWEELPSFDLDLETEGPNQDDLFFYMKELALAKLGGNPLPSWNDLIERNLAEEPTNLS